MSQLVGACYLQAVKIVINPLHPDKQMAKQAPQSSVKESTYNIFAIHNHIMVFWSMEDT